MLKQIKNLGLSLVIGCTIVSSVPVNTYGLDIHNCHREMPGNTDVERIIDLYDYKYSLSEQEESMLRQYSKYKKIKKAGKELREEYRKTYPDHGESIAKGDYRKLNNKAREIFPTFDKMTEERQDVILHVIQYYFNKEAKFKNSVKACIDQAGVRYNRGHNEFITDKLMTMYVGDGNYTCPCQLSHKGPIPKLTINGAKAAVKRHYESNDDIAKIISATEDENYITIEIGYGVFNENENYRKLKINKNTRIIESEINSKGEELVR